MIKLLLLLAFAGASSKLSIVPHVAQVRASCNATALLPISICSLDPAWEYFYISWDFASRNCPILVFVVDQCQGAAHRWWEPPCQLLLDVAREYKQRADMTPQNGSLVLQGLRSEDTGTYRVTVKGPNGETSADVNLTVTDVAAGAAWGGLSVGNSVRLGFSGLVLCLLGLIVAEFVSSYQHTVRHQDMHEHSLRKEPLHPGPLPHMFDGGCCSEPVL
ncbi:uncharacterized protein LOC115640875 [Gopherus evgoodei]|uniref:uncharacterized protein LOC115640875 n=1 Tax=Gopherus evgoodei TaxID=1825980 RepID=UPI0011CFAFF3|nr:uncharacterized protein LOC115640875 [Gopherus evgoodei]